MEYPAQLVHVPMPGLYETFLERYIMSMLRNPYPTASRFFPRNEVYFALLKISEGMHREIGLDVPTRA